MGVDKSSALREQVEDILPRLVDDPTHGSLASNQPAAIRPGTSPIAHSVHVNTSQTSSLGGTRGSSAGSNLMGTINSVKAGKAKHGTAKSVLSDVSDASDSVLPGISLLDPDQPLQYTEQDRGIRLETVLQGWQAEVLSPEVLVQTVAGGLLLTHAVS